MMRSIVIAVMIWSVPMFGGHGLAQPLEPGDSLSPANLSARAADLQRSAFRQLERRARQLAGRDEAKFTAIVRQGLTRLPTEVEKSERGLGGNGGAVTEGLTSRIEPGASDKDAQIQQAVRRVIEDGKRFGTRMVGSADVLAGQHLETVAILYGISETGCSGVVIAPGVVLTAAHCVCDLGLEREVRQIAFGNDIHSASRTDTKPEETRIFPQTTANSAASYCSLYRSYHRVCQRDIALVKFTATNASVAAVRLAAAQDVAAARADAQARRTNPSLGAQLRFEVVGYGATRVYENSARFDYGDAGRKRAAQFTYFLECQTNPLNCPMTSLPNSCLINLEIELIDLRANSDSCNGDSGGPAFVLTQSNEWRLAALVSRALRQDGSCGPGGLYSYVFTGAVRDWLGKNGVMLP
jgi:secreted trypsin-like serine protease